MLAAAEGGSFPGGKVEDLNMVMLWLPTQVVPPRLDLTIRPFFSLFSKYNCHSALENQLQTLVSKCQCLSVTVYHT